MNTDQTVPSGDDMPESLQRAVAGARAWRAAVHTQRSATPDHSQFYALAAELDETLRALSDLARLLAGQVSSYGDGRAIYDDTREVDPHARLASAAAALDELADHLTAALLPAGVFFSAIGHIGVEVTP